MTPLAERIVRRCMNDLKDHNTPFWREHHRVYLKSMSDIHCFDLTQATELIGDLLDQLHEMEENSRNEIYKNQVFLPAQKTWIEFRPPENNKRLGFLLIGNKEIDETMASMALVMDENYVELGMLKLHDSTFFAPEELKTVPNSPFEGSEKELLQSYSSAVSILLKCLILINTPKIIGRITKSPNRRLEKLLIKQQPWIGSFPLHAWTEIRLHVKTPPEMQGGEYEAHLTGKKALHFCRQHLRVRCGRLELVRAHWRGDPAIGIKRSRYLVTA